MLEVLLGGAPVGRIARVGEAEVYSFVLDEEYASRAWRPVLGQQFEDRRQHRVFRGSAVFDGLPAFFANLLPEGALRDLIEAQVPSKDAAELLARVGEDLPGAVVVRRSDRAFAISEDAKLYEGPDSDLVHDDALRFSLGGVQLKFSAVTSEEQRFTLPFRGMGGRWILKFGSKSYPGLPENEYLTMRWASRIGINVPSHRLVGVSEVAGIDERLRDLGEAVFAIERYDRLECGERVHQEDFAQIRGVAPKMKYSGLSLEGIARLVGDLCGADDLKEYLRRVLFIIVCGNTDAHLKNWSVIYPDGVSARLAPAYDLVGVGQYLDQALALPIAKERQIERVGWAHISRVERFLDGLGHRTDFGEWGREFVDECLDVWSEIKGEAEVAHREFLDDLHSRSLLVRGR